MNVKSHEPKRRRPSSQASERSKIRTNSKSFFLLNKRVCQSFFLKTLAISNGPLIKAFEHKNEYTNFFDGDDKRGKHTPSNKLSSEIVDSVINHLKLYVRTNAKSKKLIISDPEIRSLRHLFSLYKEIYEGNSPSYTSFKRIFNDNNFAFPPDRSRNKPMPSTKLEMEEIYSNDNEIENAMKQEQSLEQDLIEPKVIVTQVPDSKFFAPTQVYEVQFIEIPISNQNII
jgi:hypothetical protein